MTTSLLRKPLYLAAALVLAAGLNLSATTTADARNGRWVAGAIIGGIAAAAILHAHRHRHRHYGAYYYAAPRRCYTRRHCFYNRWGKRYCHRDRVCGRRAYCPY